MRYNKTERQGVIETDRIITNDIGWIFREQPIIDVGLDAIIEQVEDDEPMGKFLAVQIKTGEGNFHRTEKTLMHYVSNIHYNYWLNLSIPIILVAHLPNQKETYWQEIKRGNFKKNKKKWKIDIPFSQKLNEKSKTRLTSLLSKKNDRNFNIYRGEGDTEDGYHLLEDIQCISQATICINNIAKINSEQTETTLRLRDRISNFTDQHFSPFDPQVVSSYKGFSNSLVITARRLENEIEIFSELYSVGVFAFEKAILFLLSTGLKAKDLDINPNVIDEVPIQIEFALTSYSELRQAANTLNLDIPAFKNAKKSYLEVIDLICFELEAAKNITESLLEKIHQLE